MAKHLEYSGSTLAVAIIDKERCALHVAWLGDSQVLVTYKSGAHTVTPKHTVTNEQGLLASRGGPGQNWDPGLEDKPERQREGTPEATPLGS